MGSPFAQHRDGFGYSSLPGFVGRQLCHGEIDRNGLMKPGRVAFLGYVMGDDATV
jgi:hypothetical protein